jgi:DNA modification methylase
MGKLDHATFLKGNAKERLRDLDEKSVQTAVTSPPYWGLRDYEANGQLGLEATPDEYVDNLVDVFREVKRVLRDDGTFWLNIGDSYYNYRPGGDALPQQSINSTEQSLPETGCPRRNTKIDGLKEKDLCMMPSRVAFALQDDGWYVRSRIVWNKTSYMPESVKDRPTSSHEYIFLLTKNKDYYYDADAIRTPLKSESIARARRGVSPKNKRSEGAPGENTNSLHKPKDKQGGLNSKGANKRDVWTVGTASFPEAHFAVYPVELIEPCVLAGSSEGDVVLDPFSGAATTGIAALKNGRKYVGVELNEDYIELSKERIRDHNEVPANHSFW